MIAAEDTYDVEKVREEVTSQGEAQWEAQGSSGGSTMLLDMEEVTEEVTSRDGDRCEGGSCNAQTPPSDGEEVTFHDADQREGLYWKHKLLNNINHLEDLEIIVLLNYFVDKNQLQNEHKKHILEEKNRKKRIRRFFTVIKEIFDDSTYIDLKIQIENQGTDILYCLNERGLKKRIAKIWKILVSSVHGDVSDLTGYLYQRRLISETEKENIESKGSHRHQIIELMMRVEKSWNIFIELCNRIKEIGQPLDLLQKVIAQDMTEREQWDHYSDETIQSKMKVWQKVHLMLIYNRLKDAPFPEDIVDDLIEFQVIELIHIKEVERDHNYGWLITHVLNADQEACYVNLLKIIKQHMELHVVKEIEKLADGCENDPKISKRMKNIGNKYTDVQLILRNILSPTGEIVSVIELKGKEDAILRRICTILEKYCKYSGASKGSMILHMQFDSLLKLTEFWLACLNGSLQKELLDVLVTDDIKEQHDPSTLSLDMEFNLNEYVEAAYDLYLRPLSNLDNEVPGVDSETQLEVTAKSNKLHSEEVMSRATAVRQRQGLDKGSKEGIAGLVRLRGHLVLIHHFDNIVCVYQEGRSPPRIHKVPDLRDPWHMVTVRDGDNDHLVISDSYRRRLNWVPMLVEGAEFKLGAVRTIQLDYRPHGMCVSSIGQVVVCDRDTDRLYKYSSDGEFLGHIQLASVVNPRFLTSCPACDGYVISDPRQITWIKEDGTTLRSVQRGEVTPGVKLGDSHDLIHDYDGHILVADGKQVLVFDQRGHYTGQLLSDQDGIRRPTRLLLDQMTDTLYVACHPPARMMIYRYSPLLAGLSKMSPKTPTQSSLDAAT